MAPSPKANSLSAEIAVVKDLTDIFNKNSLTELELETEQISIRLVRNPQAQIIAPQQIGPAPSLPPPHAPASHLAEQSSDAPIEAAHPGTVRSPMVGTVYLAPEPTIPPFVKVGDSVKKGETLFIIEAMKVMNPITAPRDGKIISILVGDSQPIEFDQPLAIIE